MTVLRWMPNRVASSFIALPAAYAVSESAGLMGVKPNLGLYGYGTPVWPWCRCGFD